MVHSVPRCNIALATLFAVASMLHVRAAQASELPRLVATAGGGGSVRLVTSRDHQQDRLAPGFVDASMGYFFESESSLQHGLGLSASVNASHDGSATAGLDAWDQWVLAPSYFVHMRMNEAFVLSGRASIALVTQPDFTMGLEVGCSGAYLVRAGFGVYAELSTSVFRGSDTPLGVPTLHPIVSGELGVCVEYELLP